mgnify:FL=1
MTFAEPRRPAFTYELYCGSYYFYGGSGLLQSMTDQVAFAFDPESGGVFKHGNPEKVEAEAKKMNAKGIFVVSTVTFDRGFPVEELNRFVANAGYLRTYLEKNGIAFP